MSKYIVSLTMRETVCSTGSVTIEADSPSEAEAKAKKMAYDGLVYWRCNSPRHGVEVTATLVKQV